MKRGLWWKRADRTDTPEKQCKSTEKASEQNLNLVSEEAVWSRCSLRNGNRYVITTPRCCLEKMWIFSIKNNNYFVKVPVFECITNFSNKYSIFILSNDNIHSSTNEMTVVSLKTLFILLLHKLLDSFN